MTHLHRLRQPAAKRLAPPASREQISAAESSLGFKLTAELRMLYRCCDGMVRKRRDVLEHLWLFPGYFLLSLDEVVSCVRGRKRMRDWKPDWFPVFGDGGGSYYIVPSSRPLKRGVVGFLHGEPEQPVEYASLTAMFATLSKACDEGAFLTKKRQLEVDDCRFAEIALDLNPRVAFWKKEAKAAEERRDRAFAQAEAKRAHKLIRQKKVWEALAVLEPLVDRDDNPPFVWVNALYAVMPGNNNRPADPKRVRRVIDRCLPHAKRTPEA